MPDDSTQLVQKLSNYWNICVVTDSPAAIMSNG